MQRWSRRGEKSHQRPKKSEKGAVQQHPCPAPESRCRGRAVFWAYGPRHIEWPLPKVICPIFWAIGRATILPDHRRWALHFLDAESAGLGRLAPCLFFHTIQLRNPLDGLLGNGGTLCANTSTNYASDVGHAGHFRGFTFTEHAVETGIAMAVLHRNHRTSAEYPLCGIDSEPRSQVEHPITDLPVFVDNVGPVLLLDWHSHRNDCL